MFNVGDTVRVITSYQWGKDILNGDTTLIVRAVDLESDKVQVGDMETWWKPERFSLVNSDPVEVGDTVVVSFRSGTEVRGIVHFAMSSGLEIGSADDDWNDLFVFTGGHGVLVRIVKRARVIPRVWAVGDFVSGHDYESGAMPVGTVIGAGGTMLIRDVDCWVLLDPPESLNTRYPLASLYGMRSIMYIPRSTNADK